MRYLIAILLLGFMGVSHAQTTNISLTIQPVAMLDVEPDNSTISFTFGNPNEAGSSIVLPSNNNEKRINITSAVASGSTRRVDVMMTGALPSGTRLRLQTTGPTNAAVGNVGSVANGDIYLSSLPQTIVNGIGGGHTTNGSNRGFRLNYLIEIQDYSQLRASSQTVQIVYTLSDN